MAWPDLTDIRSRVRTVINESTAGKWTDACINRAINDAQRDIAIKTLCLTHVDSISTVANTRHVPFMGYTIKNVEYLPTTGKKGLYRITPRMVGYVPVNGVTPQYWFQWDKNIYIEPLPNAVYALSVTIADYPAGEMTADTDEPEIPTAFQPLLVIGAAWRLLLRDGKFSSSAQLYKNTINGIQIVKNNIVETIPDGWENFKVPKQTVQRGV